jgi:hypothetical protein
MLSPLQGSFLFLSLTWGDAPGWYLFAPLGRKKHMFLGYSSVALCSSLRPLWNDLDVGCSFGSGCAGL